MRKLKSHPGRVLIQAFFLAFLGFEMGLAAGCMAPTGSGSGAAACTSGQGTLLFQNYSGTELEFSWVVTPYNGSTGEFYLVPSFGSQTVTVAAGSYQVSVGPQYAQTQWLQETITVGCGANISVSIVWPPLTVTASGSGNGTVSSSPGGIQCAAPNSQGQCTGQFAQGSTVTLTAAPKSDSEFSGWTGACASAGTALTCTVTMSQAQDVTAQFDIIAYSLKVALAGNGKGSVNSTTGGISCANGSSPAYSCTATIDDQTSVTLIEQAQSATGSVFAGWSGGGCSGNQPSCTTTIAGSQTVTANFAVGVAPSLGTTSGNFGTVNVSTTQSLTYTLTNTGTLDAQLGDMSASGLGISAPFSVASQTCVTGMTLQAGAANSCTLVISYSPTVLGVQTSQIKISLSSLLASNSASLSLSGSTTQIVNWMQANDAWTNSFAQPWSVVYNFATQVAAWKQATVSWTNAYPLVWKGIYNPASGLVEWKQATDSWTNAYPLVWEGVYNPTSQLVEWKQATDSWTNAYALVWKGVYNPTSGLVEWKQATDSWTNAYPLAWEGVYNSTSLKAEWKQATDSWTNAYALVWKGVYSPALKAVDWKQATDSWTNAYPLVWEGVYSPTLQAVDWKQASDSWTNAYALVWKGVYNPTTQAVEWKQASDSWTNAYSLRWDGVYLPSLN